MDKPDFIFDFDLLNAKLLTEIDTGWVLALGTDLLHKETKIYSINDINYINFSAELGYELCTYSKEYSILPTFNFGVGYRHFKPDKLNLSEINDINIESKNQFVSAGFKLRAAIDYFDFTYSIDYNFLNSGSIVTQSALLSYSIVRSDWVLGNLYLKYSNDALNLDQNINNTDISIFKRFECLSFGFSIKPVAIFNTKL